MRFWWMILLLIVGCGGGSGSESEEEVPPPPPKASTFVSEARAATNVFQLELKSALKSALEEGGPVNAVAVCNTRAPQIAREVSGREKLDIRRVSEHNRNPGNEPSAAELEVLHWFEAHPAATDTVIQAGGQELYMRPIRIGVELCLQCHGDRDTLSPDLRETLAELYPDDEATGFSMGDLRGAFVVENPSTGR